MGIGRGVTGEAEDLGLLGVGGAVDLEEPRKALSCGGADSRLPPGDRDALNPNGLSYLLLRQPEPLPSSPDLVAERDDLSHCFPHVPFRNVHHRREPSNGTPAISPHEGGQLLHIIGTLRALRAERQMKATEVGELLGVSGPTISRWEHGSREPTFEDLRRWAAVFGLDVVIELRAATPEATDELAAAASVASDTESTYKGNNAPSALERALGLSPQETEVLAGLLERFSRK